MPGASLNTPNNMPVDAPNTLDTPDNMPGAPTTQREPVQGGVVEGAVPLDVWFVRRQVLLHHMRTGTPATVRVCERLLCELAKRVCKKIAY